jgi:PhnB protein
MNDTLPFAVHLVFNGNCSQAFEYYKRCFGGELTIQTLGDTPHGKSMSTEMQKVVIYATLRNEYFKLAGTDLTDEDRIISGNNISILIECNSFTDRIKLINKLIGRNYCSMESNIPLINVTDKYGIHWILGVS